MDNCAGPSSRDCGDGGGAAALLAFDLPSTYASHSLPPLSSKLTPALPNFRMGTLKHRHRLDASKPARLLFQHCPAGGCVAPAVEADLRVFGSNTGRDQNVKRFGGLLKLPGSNWLVQLELLHSTGHERCCENRTCDRPLPLPLLRTSWKRVKRPRWSEA